MYVFTLHLKAYDHIKHRIQFQLLVMQPLDEFRVPSQLQVHGPYPPPQAIVYI